MITCIKENFPGKVIEYKQNPTYKYKVNIIEEQPKEQNEGE